MKLTIVIVSWNTRDDLLRCLDSIDTNPPNCDFEVRVVDNASTDDSVAMVREKFSRVNLYPSPVNMGFGRANNLAVAQSSGEFVLLLNPDTLVQAKALDRLLNYLSSHNDVGAVGPKLLNADGTLQISAYPEPTLVREWWRLFHLDSLYPLGSYPQRLFYGSQPRSVDALMGACLLIRRTLIDQIGLFDESFFMYSEEMDLCVRIRKAGWAIHWLPEALVTHLGSQSTQQIADQMFLELYRNKVRFFRKWHNRLQVNLYKFILWQAASVRYGLAQITRLWPRNGRPERLSKAAQYKLLLANLWGF
jgi:N-acetylglucosaminyl-diphospho-decaprenol L-rhamnosyltransferase